MNVLKNSNWVQFQYEDKTFKVSPSHDIIFLKIKISAHIYYNFFLRDILSISQIIVFILFLDACSSQANCGQNTVCQAKNHGAICRCRDGFYGDPIAGCRSE